MGGNCSIRLDIRRSIKAAKNRMTDVTSSDDSSENIFLKVSVYPAHATPLRKPRAFPNIKSVKLTTNKSTAAKNTSHIPTVEIITAIDCTLEYCSSRKSKGAKR